MTGPFIQKRRAKGYLDLVLDVVVVVRAAYRRVALEEHGDRLPERRYRDDPVLVVRTLLAMCSTSARIRSRWATSPATFSSRVPALVV